MQTISTVQSRYNSIAALAAAAGAAARKSQAADGVAGASATGDAGTQVSISAAAREAAASDAENHAGYKLPDSVMQWFTKDFSPDVLDEAKARLQAIRENGELGANGPAGLPMLPENQALHDSFRAEMKALSANGVANMNEDQSARFNLLMNLDMKLQMSGWQKPLTEADVQREFDVSNAMAKLANDDPSLRPPTSSSDTDDSGNAKETVIPPLDRVAPVWRERWNAEGLTMPTNVELSPDRSMWLTLADAADIGEDEFMTHMRDLAGNLSGHALTSAMESFISERYVAKQEAERAAAA